MLIRISLLTLLSFTMFIGGTVTGWRVARWLAPVLDARDRSVAVRQVIGGWFDE